HGEKDCEFGGKDEHGEYEVRGDDFGRQLGLDGDGAEDRLHADHRDDDGGRPDDEWDVAVELPGSDGDDDDHDTNDGGGEAVREFDERVAGVWRDGAAVAGRP